MRRLAAPLAALAAAAVAACGAPETLSRADGHRLADARDRIAGALAVQRRLSSPAADRVVARVRRIVARGSFEAGQLDEFGLADLGELDLVVPGLAIRDRQGVPRRLDDAALRAFLANARTDPRQALRRPIARQIDLVDQTLADAGAAPDTHVPIVDRPVATYLTHLHSRLQPTQPDLAAKITRIETTPAPYRPRTIPPPCAPPATSPSAPGAAAASCTSASPSTRTASRACSAPATASTPS